MNIYSVLTAIIILRPEKLEQIEDERQKKKKSQDKKIYKSTLATKIRQFFYYAPNNPSFYT